MDKQRIVGESDDKNAVIDQKLRQFFDGKIVRKDLTKKKIKEGANVPVYVLEFLLGQFAVQMIRMWWRAALKMSSAF